VHLGVGVSGGDERADRLVAFQPGGLGTAEGPLVAGLGGTDLGGGHRSFGRVMNQMIEKNTNPKNPMNRMTPTPMAVPASHAF